MSDPRVVRVEESTPEDTLRTAREQIADGNTVVIDPDELFEHDGEIDLDEWIAFTANAIVLGVAQVETRLVEQAKRLFVTHAAIAAGDIPTIDPADLELGR